MLTKLVTWFLFTQSVFAQLNGEFWWLNSKVSELNGKIIPPPEYEDLTEIDTDDTRIYFNQNVHPVRRKIINNHHNVRQFKMRASNPQSKRNKMVNRSDKIIFGELKKEDNNKFVWPSDNGNNKNRFNNVALINSNNDQTTKTFAAASTTQDQFGIKFPERDTFYVLEPTKTVTTTTFSNTQQMTAPTSDSTTEIMKNITDAIFFDNTQNFKNVKKTKSICTYIKKFECLNHNGFIYTAEYGKSPRLGPKDPTLICCVLPLPIKNDNERKPTEEQGIEDIVFFPDKMSLPIERSRRSTDELRQRNVLLQRLRTQEHKTKSVPTEIVSAGDEDPYWNIKNSYNPPRKPTIQDDYKEYYAQEYADELPRPGLLGIYSDSSRKRNNWSVMKQDKPYEGGDDYDDDYDSVPSFGYASIDPRQGNKNTKNQRQPLKLTAHHNNYDPESQIINFQSTSNFGVMQGFKLLNLVRNKNKLLTKNMNEKSEENDSDDQESVVSTIMTSSKNKNGSKNNLQLFGECGKTAIKIQKDTQIGDAEEGSHPWLVVVTPTSDSSNILCYGTLVHPRAAVTTADCVAGISSNDVTVLAGLWKLNDKTNMKKRTPRIQLHPNFRHGSVANNLAVLSWLQPFKLCDHVQTACVAGPHEGKDCMLYGWGGFDQALRLRSRWQRARINECSQISAANKANLPSNAFCATVQSPNTVSGIGGPLVCEVNGRDAVVGIAVSRDTDIVYLPVLEWTHKAQELLNED